MTDCEDRPMTPAEEGVAPAWREWALERLENDEITHLAHLDYHTIDPTCAHCQALETHAADHPGGYEGYPDCEHCRQPRCEYCGQLECPYPSSCDWDRREGKPKYDRSTGQRLP